jgi:hypothetical protein
MACPVPIILPPIIPSAQVGVPYNQPLTPQFPVGNLTYGKVAGRIDFSSATNTITPNFSIIGLTSGATADVLTGGSGFPSGFFYVKNIVGAFIAGETISMALPTPRTATLDSITLYQSPAGLSVINTSLTDGAITGIPTAPFLGDFWIYAEIGAPCPAGIIQYAFAVTGNTLTLVPSGDDDICGNPNSILVGSGTSFNLFIAGDKRWGLVKCQPMP